MLLTAKGAFWQVRALCNGVIETMGRMTYDGKVKHAVTAHPKVDPDTGKYSPASIKMTVIIEEFSMRQQCLVLLLITNCPGGTRLASHLHTSSLASMRYHYYYHHYYYYYY